MPTAESVIEIRSSQSAAAFLASTREMSTAVSVVAKRRVTEATPVMSLDWESQRYHRDRSVASLGQTDHRSLLVVLSIVVSGIGGAWNATPIDGDMRLSCEKLRWVYGGDRRRGAIHHRRCSRTRLWNGSTP